MVIGAAVSDSPEEHLLIVGERGYGKRTRVGDFRRTRRGAKGVICMNVTPKTGPVVAIHTVQDGDDVVVMTARGILIRQPVRGIPVLGRNTQGVRLIRLDADDVIADVTIVPHEEEEAEAEHPASALPQHTPGNGSGNGHALPL